FLSSSLSCHHDSHGGQYLRWRLPRSIPCDRASGDRLQQRENARRKSVGRSRLPDCDVGLCRQVISVATPVVVVDGGVAVGVNRTVAVVVVVAGTVAVVVAAAVAAAVVAAVAAVEATEAGFDRVFA